MRVTIVDTLRAVSLLVERTFGEAPTTKDIHEGFDRPCSYVQPILIDSEKSGGLIMDRYEIQIIRFATRSETGYLELLQWQEALRDALEEPVAVYTEDTIVDGATVPGTASDFFLYPEDISYSLDRDDMALVVSFTVENVQPYEEPDDGSETMTELELKNV